MKEVTNRFRQVINKHRTHDGSQSKNPAKVVSERLKDMLNLDAPKAKGIIHDVITGHRIHLTSQHSQILQYQDKTQKFSLHQYSFPGAFPIPIFL